MEEVRSFSLLVFLCPVPYPFIEIEGRPSSSRIASEKRNYRGIEKTIPVRDKRKSNGLFKIGSLMVWDKL